MLSVAERSGLAIPVVTSSVVPNQWPATCLIEAVFSTQSWASYQFVSGILEDRGERRSETSLSAVFGWNSNRERISQDYLTQEPMEDGVYMTCLSFLRVLAFVGLRQYGGPPILFSS